MQVKPFTHECYDHEQVVIEPGRSLFGSVNVSFGPDKWYVDEPGYYDIHCCMRMEEQDVLANAVKIRITPPRSYDENYMAQDIITADVARVLHFNGSRVMTSANDVLHETMTKLKSAPISKHAAHALLVPMSKNYQLLDHQGKDAPVNLSTAASAGFVFKQEKAQPKEAARIINSYVFASKEFPVKKNTEAFIDAKGHIDAKQQISIYSRVLAQADNKEEALAILHQLKELFVERSVLKTVIKDIDSEIKQITNLKM